MNQDGGFSFLLPDPLAVGNYDEETSNGQLVIPYAPSSTGSASWSVLDFSDASLRRISEADAASSRSAPSLRSVQSLGSLELSPTPALSDWGSDDLLSDYPSERRSSTRSSRSAPDLRELRVMEEIGDKCGPAPRWFVSQNFLDESYKPPPPGFFASLRRQTESRSAAEDEPNGKPAASSSSSSSRSSSSSSKPGQAPFPNLSIQSSRRNRRHDAYYNVFLRRRRIQHQCRDRDLVVARGKLLRHVHDWIWCGFPGCEATVCRYQREMISQADQGTVQLGRHAARILSHWNANTTTHVLKHLLEALQDAAPGNGAGLHSVVCFAASPPILHAAVDCLILEDPFQQGYRSAASTVEGLLLMVEEFPAAAVKEHRRSHEGLLHCEEDPTPRTSRERLVPFLMRAECWRRKQAEMGYPWEWSLKESLKISMEILRVYRRLFVEGYVGIPEEEPALQDVRTDSAWRLWLEDYRPWNDHEVPFLSALQSENETSQRNSIAGRDELALYEGMGLGRGCWWPSQPRAADVDESREH